MGVGSHFRRKYYYALALLYFAVATLPATLIGQTADCPSICALRYPDRVWKNWECTSEVGQPMTTYGNNEVYKTLYLQFYSNRTGPCFICEATNLTTLLEPCKPCPAANIIENGLPWNSNDERYSKLSSCAEPGAISECAKARIPNYKTADTTKATAKQCRGDASCLQFGADPDPLASYTPFRPEMDITLRALVPLQMIVISVIYFAQALGCVITASCLTPYLQYVYVYSYSLESLVVVSSASVHDCLKFSPCSHPTNFKETMYTF